MIDMPQMQWLRHPREGGDLVPEFFLDHLDSRLRGNDGFARQIKDEYK